MTGCAREEAQQFCAKIFDDIRALSKDGSGVTRQGYGPVETATLDYLKAIGRELALEITEDAAGNVWMRLPGKDRTLPAVVAGRQLRWSRRHRGGFEYRPRDAGDALYARA